MQTTPLSWADPRNLCYRRLKFYKFLGKSDTISELIIRKKQKFENKNIEWTGEKFTALGCGMC